MDICPIYVSTAKPNTKISRKSPSLTQLNLVSQKCARKCKNLKEIPSFKSDIPFLLE